MFYLIGGINGVGKTTIISEIVRLRPEFKTFRGSYELMRWLGVENDYAALRKIPQSTKQKEYSKLLASFSEEHRDETWLFDAHYLNLIYGEVTKVTNAWLEEFSGLVLVKDDTLAVLKRIQKEPRDRGLFPTDMKPKEQLKVLNDYARQTETEFIYLADRYHLPRLVIKRVYDVETEAKQFLEFHDSALLASPNKG